jgi:hypothetical protein
VVWLGGQWMCQGLGPRTSALAPRPLRTHSQLSRIAHLPPLPPSPSSANRSPSQGRETTALSRELSDFLVELSIALHKHAIYPAGHPLVAAAVGRLLVKAHALLQERATISIGVARKQLVIEGMATDTDNALLRELSERLHNHHLGAVRFGQGVQREELTDFLLTVAADTARGGQPIGMQPAQLMPTWGHIQLFPLAYDSLALVDDAERARGGETDPGAPPTAPQLWVGLAQAALALGGDRIEEAAAADPSTVAHAIDARPKEQAYDQVIVGYLLQIAGELKGAGGADAQMLRRRISKMLSEMRPETLNRLLEMGGNLSQRKKFLLDATQGLAVDAVVDLVRAAASTSKQTVSHSMLRMLSKLAQHAEVGPEKVRSEATSALREQVQWLVTEWDLDDPNPSEYNAMLDSVSRAAPVFITNDLGVGCEAERLVAMGIEVGVLGDQVQRAVDQLLQEGHNTKLIEMLERAPADSVTAATLWQQIATMDRVQQLLHADRIDFAMLDRVVSRLGLAAVDPLFDALEVTEDQKSRVRLLDSLAKTGAEGAAALAARLPGAKPTAQRDILALFSRLPQLPTTFSAEHYLTSRDATVRREAIKLLLKLPVGRARAIIAALADTDERTLLLALGEALEDCPPEALPLIKARIDRRDLDAPMRALGIRVLAGSKLPGMLEWLLAFTAAPKRLFGGAKLAPKSPELLAALTSLAMHWNADPRAAQVLAWAAKSPDGEIRTAIYPKAK